MDKGVAQYSNLYSCLFLPTVERGIKDWKKVALYRYEDPLMGPRTIPNPDNMLGLLKKLEGKDRIAVDLEKGVVSVHVGGNGLKTTLGHSVVYLVEN